MEKSITEILHHMGEDHLPGQAVAPPLFQTSIFCFDSFEAFQEALEHESEHYIYTRGNNPTVNLCEEKIAALEHAQKAKLVSSGVAAIAGACMPFLSQGDHVVCIENAYGWARYLFSRYLERFGVTVTFVEGTEIGQFEAALQDNTRLIYLESPATFTFLCQPLREVAKLARARGIKTVIDNTWATPLFQNPIDLGIDLVVHSCTKYLGGNSDVVAGVICGSEEDMERIFNTQFLSMGPVPDPFSAWLILRALRTLHLRMPVHYENALALCRYLQGRSDVETVNYPLLPSFPQVELARSQMRGGSGLFSFRLRTRDPEKVKAVVNRVRLFKRAVSWGGYESLIDPSLAAYKKGETVPEDRISLIRIHAGLEEREMLLEDMEQALEALK